MGRPKVDSRQFDAAMKWTHGFIRSIGLIIIFFPLSNITEDSGLTCSESLDAAVGESVTLDCSSQPQPDVRITLVEWKFNDVTFLVYKSGAISPADQSEQFKDRVHHSLDFKRWTFPVNISAVKQSDAGTFSCSVRSGGPLRSCNTKLKITQLVFNKREDSQHTMSRSQRTVEDTLLTLLLASSTLLYN